VALFKYARLCLARLVAWPTTTQHPHEPTTHHHATPGLWQTHSTRWCLSSIARHVLLITAWFAICWPIASARAHTHTHTHTHTTQHTTQHNTTQHTPSWSTSTHSQSHHVLRFIFLSHIWIAPDLPPVTIQEHSSSRRDVLLEPRNARANLKSEIQFFADSITQRAGGAQPVAATAHPEALKYALADPGDPRPRPSSSPVKTSSSRPLTASSNGRQTPVS
jgi:hypothetical protein